MYSRFIFQDEISKELMEKIHQIDSEGLAEYLKDPFTFTIILLYSEDDHLIGVGFSRVIEEYKIILDSHLSNREKAIAIRELMTISKSVIKTNEIVVFLTAGGEQYQHFLEKHFNFRKREGIPLGLEV